MNKYQYHFEQLLRAEGEDLTYIRGGATALFQGVASRRRQDNLGDRPGTLRAVRKDWLILLSSLQLEEGTQTYPLVGDTILQGTLAWEVVAEDDRPHFEYCDTDRIVIRIRTIEVMP